MVTRSDFTPPDIEPASRCSTLCQGLSKDAAIINRKQLLDRIIIVYFGISGQHDQKSSSQISFTLHVILIFMTFLTAALNPIETWQPAGSEDPTCTARQVWDSYNLNLRTREKEFKWPVIIGNT
jgi:hypothetical protein